MDVSALLGCVSSSFCLYGTRCSSRVGDRQCQLAGAVGGHAGAVVEERDSATEFVSCGWEGAGACKELGGGWSGRGRLDVGARLKGEAMKGNGSGRV